MLTLLSYNLLLLLRYFFFFWCCCSVYCRIVVILYYGWCFFLYSSNSLKPGMTHTRNSNRKHKTSESQRDTQAHVPFFFSLSHPPKGERKGAPCIRTVVIFAYVKVCHHHPLPLPRHTDIHTHSPNESQPLPLTSSAAQDTCSSCCFYYQCT